MMNAGFILYKWSRAYIAIISAGDSHVSTKLRRAT